MQSYRLISSFIVLRIHSIISLVSITKISILKLDNLAVQAGLNLAWLENPKNTFYYGSHLIRNNKSSQIILFRTLRLQNVTYEPTYLQHIDGSITTLNMSNTKTRPGSTKGDHLYKLCRVLKIIGYVVLKRNILKDLTIMLMSLGSFTQAFVITRHKIWL